MNKLQEAEIYTDIEKAKTEIQKRWNNPELRKKVESYLGEIPEIFFNGPHAILFRNIMTPDHEFFHFLKLASEVKLKPLVLEYTEDKFSTRNEDKLCLTKMAIFEKRNKRNEAIYHYNKIVDLKEFENVCFSKIKTLTGESLVDFHHNLMEKNMTEKIPSHDMSNWITHNGNHAQDYYKRILAFFICHGVLFESFVTDQSEKEFEERVTLPAIKHIEEVFGLKPIIVRLLPDTEDAYWWCHPNDVENYI